MKIWCNNMKYFIVYYDKYVYLLNISNICCFIKYNIFRNICILNKYV